MPASGGQTLRAHPARRAIVGALAAIVLLAVLQRSGRAETREAIRLPDQQFYTSGSYSAYASPWSSFLDKSLQRERDFLDSIIVQPNDFPGGTRIEWRWPDRRPKLSGVWGYIAVSYGNYDSGQPQIPVPPRQVKDIQSLNEDVAWSSTGATSYNLLNEFYLTREAGKSEQKIIEIGLFLHPNSRDDYIIRTGRQIGRYTDRDKRPWQVVLSGTFCMFVPAQDVPDAHIDLKAMLDFLVREKVINGSEWFNGIAVGVEPVSGQGSTTIATWNVQYQ